MVYLEVGVDIRNKLKLETVVIDLNRVVSNAYGASSPSQSVKGLRLMEHEPNQNEKTHAPENPSTEQNKLDTEQETKPTDDVQQRDHTSKAK